MFNAKAYFNDRKLKNDTTNYWPLYKNKLTYPKSGYYDNDDQRIRAKALYNQESLLIGFIRVERH